MLRRSVILLAIAAVAAPAAAANYSAKLTTPTSGRIIGRDISWACGADACQGATPESRPVVLCQDLAKRAGRVDAFLVDGRAFSTAELGKCNTSAKDGTGKALSAQ